MFAPAARSSNVHQGHGNSNSSSTALKESRRHLIGACAATTTVVLATPSPASYAKGRNGSGRMDFPTSSTATPCRANLPTSLRSPGMSSCPPKMLLQSSQPPSKYYHYVVATTAIEWWWWWWRWRWRWRWWWWWQWQWRWWWRPPLLLLLLWQRSWRMAHRFVNVNEKSNSDYWNEYVNYYSNKHLLFTNMI